MGPSTITGPPSTERRVRPAAANLCGGLALLCWTAQALLTNATSATPSFLRLTIVFAIAGLPFLSLCAWSLRRARQLLRQPARTWAIYAGGLFGYHALYFLAFEGAWRAGGGATALVNLLNYLWPLLILLLAAALGEPRAWSPAVLWAGLSGFAGTVLLFLGRPAPGGGDPDGSPGPLLAAALAAVVWAFYSVLSGRTRAPTAFVSCACLATSALSAAVHLAGASPAVAMQELSAIPGDEWAMLVLMGVGPLGGAFYLWNAGMAHGNRAALAIAAYFNPLGSTLLLCAVDERVRLTPLMAAGGILVVLPALLATLRRVRLTGPAPAPPPRTGGP